MEKIKSWTVSTKSETDQLAAELSERFKPGDVVLLEGNLGAGKTFLVQRICAAWDVTEPVTSPTFTLIQHYDSGNKAVVHMDLYRLDRVEQLDQLGWEDSMTGDTVAFVEWPQLIQPLLQSYYHVHIRAEREQRVFELSRKERA